MDTLMSSRVLSRILPTADGDAPVSVYERLRSGRRPDVEAQHYATTDHDFHDDDEDEDDPDQYLYNAAGETPPTRHASHLSPKVRPFASGIPAVANTRSNWLDPQNKRKNDEDEDVPDSLLLDPRDRSASSRPLSSRPPAEVRQAQTEAQWKAVREQQGLHHANTVRSNRPTSRRSRPAVPGPPSRSSPQAEATWMFTNASNLDTLLLEIYQYFAEHGVWSILLSRVLALVTELFVFSFAMFLTTCVDYSKIPTSKHTSEIMIPQCMKKASWLKNAALFFFIIYWLTRLAHYVRDARRLFKMHDFYHHVLGVSDQDIQTTTWAQVVEGLTKVANAHIATANPSARGRKYLDYRTPQQKLTAETVANRLMRQANYYIAMYNKDILDFSLPLPFVGKRQFYSKSLEWCIDFCLTNFIFDEQGNIKTQCLDVKNRHSLVETLRLRLRFTALTSIVIAPVNILRFCVLFFFRYYTEFTRNPSKVSARSFTPFAEWKVRQFNELDHLFQKRIRQAYPFANEYLKQFPKDKTDQICRFIAFVSGAIAAVLTIATLFDPELFLGFEVTPGRTAVFWLTVMVGVFGVANGALPEENDIHDPVFHLKEVLMFMGTMPSHWKPRLHSNEVRAEFSAMYQMKILIFLEEVLSLVVTPWILWRNSNHSCERLVDFFREHTVHVEGIGYQCNFAVFNFKKDPNQEDARTILEEGDLREDYYGTKDDKLTVSMANFRQYYSQFNAGKRARRQGVWQPPPAWPPVMQPPAILEEESDNNVLQGKLSSGHGRRSGMLDSRRQPSTSVIYSPTQKAASGRRKAPHEIGKRSVEGASLPGATESRLMAQDSDLQDFADAPGMPQFESETDGDDGDEHVAGQPGVLGLLYQFSKAQTERGNGAVNI